MNWIWLAVLVSVAWLFENVAHEASHLLTAAFKGCKPLGLYPFFHWTHYSPTGEVEYRWWRPWELWKKPWSDARWFFARCRYVAPTAAWPPHTIIHIAPFIWGTSLFVGAGVASIFNPIIALPFAGVGLLDALWWVRGYFWGSPFCDGKRWKNGDQRA
jgi:hypothetical protein